MPSQQTTPTRKMVQVGKAAPQQCDQHRTEMILTCTRRKVLLPGFKNQRLLQSFVRLLRDGLSPKVPLCPPSKPLDRHKQKGMGELCTLAFVHAVKSCSMLQQLEPQHVGSHSSHNGSRACARSSVGALPHMLRITPQHKDVFAPLVERCS
jgi:hypothetical protein